MTEPTEAEVEAATLAVKEIDVGDGYFFWPEEAEALARAALTAAAQVRERAAEQHKRDRPCAICAGTGRFVIGMICST